MATESNTQNPSAPPQDAITHENGQSASKKKTKLHGRAFYESIGSPKVVLAPMVEQSEFAWRMLSRSFLLPSSSRALLAYTPMFHSRMFADMPKYRDSHFQPLKGQSIPSLVDPYHISQFAEADYYLDGNSKLDRPLFVQFCSNSPDDLLAAAKHVAPFCDAVDLNLGCPQGIAKRGHYGAFLQEDQDLIARMINRLHKELDVPITAKMRILETREQTLAYAKKILDAGASIITVHGRRREQKGHNTGLADWKMIRFLRENLPPETVLFANGNILQHDNITKCLDETGADAVMSAEGNLYDPTIFAEPPPVGQEGREYWRGRDGKGGYRMDAVMRRYMDIIHKYALGSTPPERKPLFLPSDPPNLDEPNAAEEAQDEDGPPKKKQKQSKADRKQQVTNPNLTSMQAHLFHLLRSLVSQHHNVRDALAKCRVGDIAAFENVLRLVEQAVKEGLITYEKDPQKFETSKDDAVIKEPSDPYESSLATVAKYKRPWWVCQPYVRPLPKEAIEKGSMSLSKKEKARLAKEEEERKKAKLVPEGSMEKDIVEKKQDGNGEAKKEIVEIPKEGVVCG